ncbi:MAG: translation initiation factor IF-2 [Patescibacteria group bacterium]
MNKTNKSDSNTTRPPIVAVMGHIDHGKTSLLDKIRETSLAAREAGGITQHIGASQVEFKSKDGVKKITFIDTPGHAAFTKMRARGALVTDLVVLVVAADSGIQEQTQESLNHIKVAGVPFLVAINKIDLPNADVEGVKEELVEAGLIPEDYGGKLVVAPVSAKEGTGIPDLLEMISLLAEMQDIKADAEGSLEASVIESSFDIKKGVLATLVVRNGKISLGDEIFAEDIRAKVRAMKNGQGKMVKVALPGDSVEVLGFDQTPVVGSPVGSSQAEKKIETLSTKTKNSSLKMILKADVSGSLEAIEANLPGGVELIHTGLGEVNESDIFLSQTTGAKIYSFNLKLPAVSVALAKQIGIEIAEAKIIYELLEELEKELSTHSKAIDDKQVAGKAVVVAEFKIGDKRVAGCRVTEGTIGKTDRIRILRSGKLLTETRMASMKHRQDDVDKADKGDEFGAVFASEIDFRKGDVILSHISK